LWLPSQNGRWRDLPQRHADVVEHAPVSRWGWGDVENWRKAAAAAAAQLTGLE
jgi:hypothetical protein